MRPRWWVLDSELKSTCGNEEGSEKQKQRPREQRVRERRTQTKATAARKNGHWWYLVCLLGFQASIRGLSMVPPDPKEGCITIVVDVLHVCCTQLNNEFHGASRSVNVVSPSNRTTLNGRCEWQFTGLTIAARENGGPAHSRSS